MANQIESALEDERLAALYAFAILDTPVEEYFDSIAQVVALALNVPYSFISFVDKERVWIKAAHGLQVTESPREDSFCGHAIQSKEPLIVSDAALDERFQDLPMVIGAPHIRFYLGMPIVARTGHVVGALCIMDCEPRNVVPSDVDAMRSSAKLVIQHLELRRVIEEQKLKLRASAKMASLGQMAAGIAHEINNPLQIIEMRAALMETQPDISDATRKASDQIRATVDRIAKIIRSLRGFSKDNSQVPFVEESVQKIIDDTLQLCASRLRSQEIDIRVVAPASAERVLCSPTQVTQVLINLINNALDAIATFKEKWIKIESSGDEENFYIKVTDCGHGVDPEVASKMMSAFFTTKATGTGLGLSLSREIVARHGGELTLDSTCSNTCFVIRLPRRVRAPNVA